MSDFASIDELIQEISTTGLKGNRSEYDIGTQVNILRRGWDAVDKWITATMRVRKGVHLPTLCKMTWEYLDDSSDAEVRMRPVFVLTESFLRGLRLSSYQKPVLPARSAHCEDLNLSQVSIKYSDSLTKDALFVVMRDIVRKMTEYVANNRSFCLKLTVGKLMAKGKKVWFEFDVNAFADEDFSITSAAEPVQTVLPSEYENVQAQSVESEPSEGAPETQVESTIPPSTEQPERGEVEYEEMDKDFKLLGQGSSSGDTCLEDAYSRFISNLEKDAVKIEAMETEIRRHEDNAHQKAEQSKQNRQEQVEELQVFIKQQMEEKRKEREDAEKESRKPWLMATTQAPILTRNAGVADVLGASPPPVAVDESQLTPRSLMVHRMRSRITDGGIRGKNSGNPDRHHLLSILQGQIGAKESLARSRKEADLEEERRYLEHVKAEMHLHTTYTKSNELTKQRDLLASWERDGHLKNLNKLKSLGPRAMREYAKEALGPSSNPACDLSHPNSARSNIGRMSVGYDPRSA